MTRATCLLRTVFFAFLFFGSQAERAWPAAERWVEVKSPHFVVNSNAGEKEARRIAEQFEIFRAVFQKALPSLRVDPGQPLIIVAAKNENTLKLFMPQFWEKKGSVHPSGYFVPGRDKHYVTLRLDTEGDNPYHVVYHEYVHMIMNLNFTNLPTWLNEGLAEFYANATIRSKDVDMGRPSLAHLSLLGRRQFMPLDVLLNVDISSPQYNEADTASIFYAESWALAHFMMLDNKTGHMKELSEFMSRVQEGADPRSTFQALFGSMKEFEIRLQRYTEQPTFVYATIKLPTAVDVSAFSSRELSAAEAIALRGDFQVHMNLPTQAKAALEEAIQLDPKLAAPRESLGMLSFQQHDLEGALKWFGEAIQLDSTSFLTHYYYALLCSQDWSLSSERAALAEKGLRRAIELNPNFAPAYAALSHFYLSRHEHLDDAFTLAKQAVQLEPGTLSHYLAVVNALMSQEKYDEAQKMAQRVFDVAKSPRDRAESSQLLQSIQAFVARLAERKRYEENLRQQKAAQVNLTPEPGEVPKLTRQSTSGRPASPAEAASSNAPPPNTPSVSAPHRQTAPAEGRVTAVTCKGPVLDFTLDYSGFKMNLHTENYFKVEFLAYFELPEKFNPCESLKGRNVKVEYVAVTGMPYAGEAVQIEIAK